MDLPFSKTQKKIGGKKLTLQMREKHRVWSLGVLKKPLHNIRTNPKIIQNFFI
jgi:hypothetical protein